MTPEQEFDEMFLASSNLACLEQQLLLINAKIEILQTQRLEAKQRIREAKRKIKSFPKFTLSVKSLS